MLLIDEGQLEEAHELLRPLTTRTRFLRHEMIYYMRTQARLAIAKQEYDMAEHSLQAILELDPDDTTIQAQLARLSLITRLSSGFSSFFDRYRDQARQRRGYRRARTVLTPDSTLTEGLAQLLKDTLVGMTHALGITGISGQRKAEMRDHIVAWLRDPALLPDILRDLTAEERAALRYVLDAGGLVPWDEFSQRYDDDWEESQSWNHHQPETVMGRLRVRGLLVEGLMAASTRSSRRVAAALSK